MGRRTRREDHVAAVQGVLIEAAIIGKGDLRAGALRMVLKEPVRGIRAYGLIKAIGDAGERRHGR